MKQRIEIIPPGESVQIASGMASIAQVCIGMQNHVTYQCVWWENNTRKIEWLESFEILAFPNNEKQDIGFHKKG